VLYEILAGRRAFAAPSVASTLGAILHKTPEPLRAPPALNSLVFKCLSKLPAARFQTATDLQTALTKASHSGNFGVVEPNGPHRFGKLRLIIGGALLAVLGIVALAGGIHWNRIKSAPIDSIAVLPLDMRSTDPEADYISDGIINQDDWSIAPRIAGPKARQAAQKALQLDESNAEAHVVLAIESQWYEWDWAAAEREFK
jgi:serine/threonine protein kinase